MKRVAIVGGGVSGLTCAQFLKESCNVVIFEKEHAPGGLIRCQRIAGSLFHLCGGHVFNTKDRAVSDWFWSKFDRDRDFIKADRRSAVCLEDGTFVDYPIENHVYQLGVEIQRRFYADVEDMLKNPGHEAGNFDEFLRYRFGKTLYELYFRPYNAKVWRRDLSEIPLSWLEGKLPMPTPQEMLEANRNHIEEKSFVHSTFYYEKNGGSQFIADTLAMGVDVRYDSPVRKIEKMSDGRCKVNGETFDQVVFCGNIKELPLLYNGVEGFADEIAALESHGTTAAFCETAPIPYSWFYQPSSQHQSHRFICTGNFAPSNNAPGKMTCTVEFTDEIGEDEIKRQLLLMPFHPRYLTKHYSKYTYPIQHEHTRDLIAALKRKLAQSGIYLVGRFAEWEYFNMDAAMSSALRFVKREFQGW